MKVEKDGWALMSLTEESSNVWMLCHTELDFNVTFDYHADIDDGGIILYSNGTTCMSIKELPEEIEGVLRESHHG